MLIVSVILIGSEKILKESTMNVFFKWINPAVEFLMNWMVLFFLPPLISIVNSKNLPNGSDIVKLIIVFFLGLILFIPLVGFFIHYNGIIYGKLKAAMFKKSNDVINNEKHKDKNCRTELEVSFNDNNNDNEHNKYNNKYNNKEVDGIIDITEYSDYSFKVENELTEIIDKDNKPNNDKSNNDKPNNDKSNKNNFQWKSSAIPSKYCVITYLIIYAISWIPAALWNFTQPLHIAVNVLSLFISLCVPDKIRIIFHPLIGCTVFSYALLWIEGMIFGRSLKDEIGLYSNDIKYITYLNDTSLPFPRAGEILFIFLDAIVVAFSFRILEHHRLIINHIVELVGSIILMSFLSMLVHITLCRIIGVTPIYALSMASR